jgi:hypothetical protein
MTVFSRQVDVVVAALSWRRTVVVEQGRWRSRCTAWKPPHGDNVRNLRAVQKLEPDIEIEAGMRRAGASTPPSRSHDVLAKHTLFEYEEFEWRKLRVGRRCRLKIGALGDEVKQVTPFWASPLVGGSGVASEPGSVRDKRF